MSDTPVSIGGIATDFVAEGAAFPMLIKVVATLFVAAIVWSGLPALRLMQWSEFTDTAAVVWGCAAAITGLIYFWMLKSRTSIRAGVIEQTWIWDKRIAIDQIRQAKFIYVPHLTWLIAPRLVVRSGVTATVFYAADPSVQKAFARLVSGG
jgi:hypothetical protein